MRTGTLSYGDERIAYSIREVATRRSRIAIHVDPDGTVSVDAPPAQTDERIAASVQRRARWIVDRVGAARDRFRNVSPREYVSGEQVLYLGRRYVLKVIPSSGRATEVKLRGNRLEVAVSEPTPPKIKALLRQWYRTRAADYLGRRVEEISRRLPWVDATPPVRFQKMVRQWGNCSSDGRLVLNPDLVKAPRDGIDYVITHELAHLKHMGHGPEFWSLVETVNPRWREAKTRLDGMVEVLTE